MSRSLSSSRAWTGPVRCCGVVSGWGGSGHISGHGFSRRISSSSPGRARDRLQPACQRPAWSSRRRGLPWRSSRCDRRSGRTPVASRHRGRVQPQLEGRESSCQDDEDCIQAIDHHIAGQHQRRHARPVRVLGPADIAPPHQASCPAERSSSASRRIVSTVLASCSFERSPYSSTIASPSAARSARSACSSLQCGARSRTFSFAVMPRV